MLFLGIIDRLLTNQSYSINKLTLVLVNVLPNVRQKFKKKSEKLWTMDGQLTSAPERCFNNWGTLQMKSRLTIKNKIFIHSYSWWQDFRKILQKLNSCNLTRCHEGNHLQLSFSPQHFYKKRNKTPSGICSRSKLMW